MNITTEFYRKQIRPEYCMSASHPCSIFHFENFSTIFLDHSIRTVPTAGRGAALLEFPLAAPRVSKLTCHPSGANLSSFPLHTLEFDEFMIETLIMNYISSIYAIFYNILE